MSFRNWEAVFFLLRSLTSALKTLHYHIINLRAGFPHSSVGKESACSVGDLGSIPRSGRSPGEGKPTNKSNSGPQTWQCIRIILCWLLGPVPELWNQSLWDRSPQMHGFHKFTSASGLEVDDVLLCLFCFPGGSYGKESACSAGDSGFGLGVGKIPWRKAWQPTPVFLSGESHGQRNLAGYSP